MNNEQKMAEEALMKSKKWHRSILRAAMDGFWMVDLEGRLLEVNNAYCRMSGYSEPELLAMRIPDLEVLETGEEITAHITKIIAVGQDRFATRHRRKDGSIFDIEVSAQYHRSFEGGRMIAFLHDITEQKRADDALRESESFIKAVMDNLPIGIAVNSLDPAVAFQYMNDNFPGFYRTSREALAAPDTFWNAVYEDPDFRAEMRKRVLDDCASGDPEKMRWVDVPITRPGEKTTYVEAKNTRIPGKRLMVSTVWDVTRRKEAELALQQEQELYEDLVKTLPAGAYRWRAKILGDWRAETWQTMAAAQYSLDFASDRFCAIIGVTHETLAANPGIVSDSIHPADKDDFNARNAQAMTDFNPFIWEGRIINNQQTRWVHFESLPRVIDPDTVLWTGIVYDITERKQAEETLRENENRLRFALEGTNDGLWDVQMTSGTTYLSPRGCEILGYRPDEACAVASVWADLVHPDDLVLTYERMRAHIEGRTPIFEVEQRLRMKSGDWKWVLARGKVVARDEHGEPLRMTGTHTDLTEQKKLQAQLSQAQKMESVGRLAGGVAHDFNNMLSVILGHAELAQKKAPLSLSLREDLEQIQKAAERSAAIVRQLLAFARKQTVTPRVLDLNETVDSMLKMLRRLIGEEIDLIWLAGETLWPVRMDPAQIDQLLVNLCINARDAITGGGRITIETGNKIFDAAICAGHKGYVPGEYVMLTVNDDGSGMDKETRQHIFEPFFTTKEMGQGTGLGLAMVYGIVKQNAGFIDVYSEPGQGTSFKIYLPRCPGQEEQAETAGGIEPAGRGQETVLLVEDEPAILDLGRQLLEMLGYQVLAARTPGEAIRLAREHSGEIHLRASSASSCRATRPTSLPITACWKKGYTFSRNRSPWMSWRPRSVKRWIISHDRSSRWR